MNHSHSPANRENENDLDANRHEAMRSFGNVPFAPQADLPDDYFDDSHPGCDSNGFDLRAPFPHASDPHWSSPEADFARW